MKFGAKAFIVYKKKVLLLLRDNKPSIPYPNTWNLPGGGVEEGESYDQALERELLEELGVVPKKYKRLGIETFDDGRITVRYLVWLDDAEVKRLKLGEGQRMHFFSFDDMLELPFSPYLGNFIRRNAVYLKKIIEDGEDPVPEKLGLDP